MNLLRNRRASLGILVILGLALILSIVLYLISPPQPVLVPALAATARPTDLGAGLVTRPTYPSLSYGIQAFLWWNRTTRPRDLELVRQMRFDTVKQLFNWVDVRPDPATPYDWSHADAVVDEVQYYGLKLIARIGRPPEWAILPPGNPTEPPVDLTALAGFCGDLAARYRGQIAGYEVWNEPNLTREWNNRPPNPVAYVRLLAACYRAIKAADPGAVVISAGLAPTGNEDDSAMPDDRYLREMYQAGLSAYYDVLGLNAPGYRSPPEMPPNDPTLNGFRWQCFRHVEDMRAIMVANGDGAKQIALLEVGWTTDQRDQITSPDGQSIVNPYRWHAVTEKQQAQYLVGAYRYAAEHWRPWVGLIVTIYLADPSWTQNDEEYWWAITLPGYNIWTRPAFADLANMARYVGDKTSPAIDPGQNYFTPMPPRLPMATPTARTAP